MYSSRPKQLTKVAAAQVLRTSTTIRHRLRYLCGLRIARRAKDVERGLKNRLEVARVAVDLGDGDDHVGDLLPARRHSVRNPAVR